MNHISLLTFSLVIICISQQHLAYSWGWFSSTHDASSNYDERGPRNRAISNGVGDFSVEPLTDRKGVKLVENARQKLVSSNTCWQNAYRNLFAGCSEILADKEKQSRLAWQLSDCFQKDTGRSPFPSCDARSLMVKCLKNLDESAHTVYLEFYLETNSICHQLQTDAFKHETERLVNDLKKTAQFAEEKLEDIEEKSEQLLHHSDQIQQSITSIDLKTQQVAQSSKDVGEQIDVVLNHSKEIFEQSKEIAASQSELREGQTEMRRKLEAGMEMLHESYHNLGQDIERLRGETVEIEKEIQEVSNTMSLKMTTLQNTADDIGKVAGKSLDQQNQLLDGQSTALEGLEYLTKFQSQALEESRLALEKLVEFGHKQQEELLHRQKQLQKAHDHLFENSKSILEAQEAFESKQASMFMALDRLFMLHNSILLESRAIKAFFFYCCVIFVLYMFTSCKQTYYLRARLYLGLCATFMVEFAMCRSGQIVDQQTWLSLVRSTFVVVACIQLAYSLFTYRDYEMLNHTMLKTMMDKINTMENRKHLSYDMESDDDDDDDDDDDLDFLTWVDTDLPEDVNCFEDPDFIIPEEVAENSRKYDFRRRFRR